MTTRGGATEGSASAVLRWEREFPAAFDLVPYRQMFRSRVPAVRSLDEDAIATLVQSGINILPDDCTAVVRAGNYGAAVRVPATFEVTGEPGSWKITSDKVIVPGHGEADVAGHFLGGCFLKVSCGLRIFYPSSSYHLLLTAPPNTWIPGFRIWCGLQAVDYKDCELTAAGLRQFNTNLILEPLSSFKIVAGTVLAVLYLVPHKLRLVEGAP